MIGRDDRVAEPVPPGDGVTARRWQPVRRGAYVLYLAVVICIVIADGVPTGRLTLAILIVTALLLTSIGRGWRRAAQVVLDWLPFTAVLLLYDRTRGVADSLGISLHEAGIVHAERWLFDGVEPTVWLQQHLYDPAHVYWYDALCTLVYTTHFLATPILAAVLWLRDRTLWVRYISRVVVLAVAGLITYCVFPEAPPWLAAKDGLTPPVARLSARGWTWFHLGNVKETLAHAQDAGSNPVAAMPSLHIAFATLVALTLGSMLHSRWRYLVVLYPLAMGFTLVYCGEHWVLDLLAGVAYALLVHLALNRFEARRARRRSGASVTGGTPDTAVTSVSAGAHGT